MSQIDRKQVGLILITVSVVLALTYILIRGPMAQNVNYHLFKDTRNIWFIPNFWNVVSNISLIMVGSLGLYKVSFTRKLIIIDEMKIAYSLFFMGIKHIVAAVGVYILLTSYENRERTDRASAPDANSRSA